MSRTVNAGIGGAVFALVMWAIMSVCGEPHYAHHHLTDVLVMAGFVYALGSWNGYGEGRRSFR